MRLRATHITCLLFCSLIPYLGSGQDLISDIKKVSETYASHTSYVFEWVNYFLDSPEDKQTYILKKCDDYFYLKGNGQINCINGTTQVSVNDAEKTVVYLDNASPTAPSDPMATITSLFNTSYSAKLDMQIGYIKKYTCTSAIDLNNKIDLWIDTKEWKILKVIQHLNDEITEGLVFELKDYKPFCDAGPEINIQSYIKLDSHHKPALTEKYRKYKIFTPDNLDDN